jgi:hypothetical protein
MTGVQAVNQVPDHSKLYLQHLCEHFIVESPTLDLEIDLRQASND